MSDNTKKNSSGGKPGVEYLGWWGFLLLWLKVFALTAVVVLVLKYVFRVPLTF